MSKRKAIAPPRHEVLFSSYSIPGRHIPKWQRSGRRPRSVRGLFERIAQLPNELIQMVQELVVSTQLNTAFNSRKQLTYRGTWRPNYFGPILSPEGYDPRFDRIYDTEIITLRDLTGRPTNERLNMPISGRPHPWGEMYMGWTVGARSILPGRTVVQQAMAILQAGLDGLTEFGPSRYPPLSDPRRRVPPPGPSGPFADARRRVPPPS